MASLTPILPGPAGRAALPGAQAPHLGRRLRSRPGSGAPGQGRAAAPGAWAGSSGGSGPAPRARTSGCRAPTGSRAPRPRNPALLGRSLPRPPGHNQAAHRTPGEMWVRALSSWGAQWLCLKHPPTPPPTLTCWKPMQRPSGQEYSGQGAWVPLGPPGADSPSEGKGRESTVRQGAAATSCLALHQGTQVPLPQASSSSPWGQSGTPSQSRSGCRHTWGAEAQGKRSPHGGSWVEPVDTEVSPCAPAPPGLSLQRGWQEWLEAWSGSRWETEPRCTRIPGRCCNLRAVALYFWERWPGHGGLTPRGTKGTPKSGEEEPPNRPAPQTQTQRAPPSHPGHPFLPKCRQKQKPLSPLPWAWVEGSSLQREFHEKGQRRPMPQT